MPTKAVASGVIVHYPRTYQVGGRGTLNGLATFLACLGPSLPISHWSKGQPLQTSDLIAPFLMGAFAFWMFFCINQRVILTEDAIELRTWLSKRKLGRNEIIGYRTERTSSKAYGAPRYVFVPRSRGERLLKLPRLLRCDQDFYAWTRTIERIRPASSRSAVR